MQVGKNYRINGTIIKDNDQYVLTDSKHLKNLIVSHTLLKKRQATNGHKHDDAEEVYIFTEGEGTIQINAELIPVEAGDTIAIPAGAFHKVVSSTSRTLEFISIFETYAERA